jgi:hypothetical protein
MLQTPITRTQIYHLIDLLPESLLAEVARFIEFILYFRGDTPPQKIEPNDQATWQQPFDEFLATFEGEPIELSDQELVDLVHEVRQEKLNARGH